MKWMIYGANGYTGELIAREAVRRNERPVLAGRNAERINKLARELGCEARIFDVDRPILEGITLVLHCAGPFVHTSAPMVRACLESGAHYLDITGEISVFESVMAKDAEAKGRGVTLLPGVGFDVVPTDCLAAMLKARLPDATDLILAFSGGAGVSAGTQKTIVEGLRDGGAIRRNGEIVRVPVLYDTRQIPFPGGSRLAMTIPWGDVSTAFHTTGIPNIRVYRATSPRAVARLRRIRPFLPALASPPLKWILRNRAARQAGPDAAARERGRMELWGSASNGRGDSVEMSLVTPEGYALTVLTAIGAAMGVLHEPVQPGSLTPARRFGADFITRFPGVTVS
ncbi:MAG: saccharopine dehydrogenase family protein [Thermoanaerobaculia bacterium]